MESTLHPDSRSEGGMALVVALLFTIIVLGITLSGAVSMQSHRTQIRTNFVSHAQAVQFARSGLKEALGWMRKQTAQPVTSFDPVLDPAADPPILDTIDPEIGIAREFKITGSIWGRYEVFKDWPSDPDPARLVWREGLKCRDVSAQRGSSAAGSVWLLRSIGYVFRRVDPGTPFNQLPNQVLAQGVLEVEARRLSLQPPGQAALCSSRGDSVRILTKGRVLGGSAGAGIYYPTSTGAPTVGGAGASVTGVPPMSASSTYDDGIEAVFGASLEDLEAMADRVVTSPSEFPSPVPTGSLVICKAPMTFTASASLRGTGAVLFLGDATLEPGSYSAFSGLLYVQGNLEIHEPAEIQGAIVVRGTTTITGSADYSTISFDDGILNALRLELGSYRFSGAFGQPLSQDL
ncbi:MAG: hypothetical protein Fur0037_08950 [Planctomycetota bacterium]